jgi:hypothetical protein
MKTIKPVEQASDSQLRSLVRQYAFLMNDKLILALRSTLPLLTVERAQFINLLKLNHVTKFMTEIV